MKKFWIVLLSLGLIVAFSMPAFAATARIGGSYVVTGSYEKNRTLMDDDTIDSGYFGCLRNASEAFYAQRLRLEPQILVAEGLKLNMRVDAMERVWGQFPVGGESSNPSSSRNTSQEQNVQFRRAWVDFTTKYGTFSVGYMWDGFFDLGTFGCLAESESPVILWSNKFGPLWVWAFTNKLQEGRLGSFDTFGDYIAPGYTDSDFDRMGGSAVYSFSNGEVGMTWFWFLNGTTRASAATDHSPDDQFKMNFHWLTPHFKATFGPLYVEGLFVYQFGDFAAYDDGSPYDDVDLSGYEWYLNAKYNMGPAFIGLQYGFTSGDDPSTEDEIEMIMVPGQGVWQPCLILWNDWQHRFAGNHGGVPWAQINHQFVNASLVQLYGGYNPTPKLSVKASVAYAWADEVVEDDEDEGIKDADDNIGTEVDVSVSYKIYDNLTYMIGFGYLFTGDYFKGGVKEVDVEDDYLVIHQLTLSF